MKQLTVCAIATPGWGHINACSGALKTFLKRGHRVIFVIERAWSGKLAPLGFEEFTYPTGKAELVGNAGDTFAKDLMQSKVFGPETPMEKLLNVIKYLDGPDRLRDIAEMDNGIRMAIKKFKPDLIFLDGNACLPTVHYSDIPWVRCISSAPSLYVEHSDTIPPGGSGLPSDSDREEWPKWNKLRRSFFYGKGLNDHLERLGYQRYPNDARSPVSQSLTVYAYPEEFNYEQIRQMGWFNLEVFNKNETKEVIELSKLVPQDFLNDTLDGKWSGKYAYVSMGSLGSIDLGLMKRLVEVLAKTNHKYIFAKGARHAEYELAKNMWGERFLPQTRILPIVHLVITHGGNNTITETFAQGKPMIIMPNFVDQFDNAQRLDETGFGVRLHPYQFTDRELTDAVDRLLYNSDLKCKLEAASKRIQSTDRHLELALKMEEIARLKSCKQYTLRNRVIYI